MKTKNKKQAVCRKIKTAEMILLMLAAAARMSFAAINPYSEEFSSSSGIDGWTKIQEDPNTPVQWSRSGGCLFVNVQDTVAGNEITGYTLGGILEEKETVKVTVQLVNVHNNYYKGCVQLWNSTGNVLLAESEQFLVYGAKDARYKPVDIKLDYTAASGDAGATVQVRLVENCNAPHRDLIVDSISVISTAK